MYIKIAPRKNKRFPTTLSVTLLESVKLNGRTRKRILKYLGCISINCVLDAGVIENFAKKSIKKMEDLNLTDSQKQILLGEIQDKLSDFAGGYTDSAIQYHKEEGLE